MIYLIKEETLLTFFSYPFPPYHQIFISGIANPYE